MKIYRFLLGKPFASRELKDQRLRKLKALPVFSSDALSSVAYATEEILRVLILAGASALTFSIPIAFAICGLIIILGASYWQTIHAYPNGGGAFTVASENLGMWPSLLAAAALLIDYILTVAVSVSAGVRAITSAFPFLLPYTVILCLLSVAIIAIINLRGVHESATAFAFPTYAFVILILILIGAGLYQYHSGVIIPAPAMNPAHFVHHPALTTISVLLILRAFSAGCTALTGIECVANGVPVFEEPVSRNAGQTLLILAFLLTVMFFGITYLTQVLHLHPEENQSLLSILGHYILGNGVFYYALQGATMLVLLLAANTSFAGFPRLASVLAEKSFLPIQLKNLGDHLSFSNGIVVLAVISGLLIILFHGDTHLLIPLYAIGVFTAFCMSQLGMVFHWLRVKTRAWYIKAAINGLGFITTGMALIVIIDSKLLEGAWLVVLFVPILLMMFYKIHQHYIWAERQLAMTLTQAKEYLRKNEVIKQKVVLPIARIHRGTLAALNFAKSVSDDVKAVSINLNQKDTDQLIKDWESLESGVPLHILESPYRSTVLPLLRFINKEDMREPQRGLCMLVLPEAVPSKWWHELLHNQRAMLLKASLFYNRKHAGDTRIFVDVPYQLGE